VYFISSKVQFPLHQRLLISKMTGNIRCYFAGFSSEMFIIVIAVYGQPVLADAGDDFSNNLFSDLGTPFRSFAYTHPKGPNPVGSSPHLAPLIALFGEQVAKQYLSQSMHWLEHVIFGCAPLGIITAVTCAIRVTGSRQLKAVIGRARESDAQAEIEIMRLVAFIRCCYYLQKG